MITTQSQYSPVATSMLTADIFYFYSIIGMVIAYSGGAGSCQGPLGHGSVGSQLSTDNSGMSIFTLNTNGTIHMVMQSERPFKGYLVKTDRNLIFSEAPEDGQFYDDCPSRKNGVAHAAVTHNNPSLKSTVNATMQCGNVNGTVHVTVLIVFDLREPYRQLNHDVQCFGTSESPRSSASRRIPVGVLLIFATLSLISGLIS